MVSGYEKSNDYFIVSVISFQIVISTIGEILSQSFGSTFQLHLTLSFGAAFLLHLTSVK